MLRIVWWRGSGGVPGNRGLLEDMLTFDTLYDGVGGGFSNILSTASKSHCTALFSSDLIRIGLSSNIIKSIIVILIRRKDELGEL